MSFKAMTWAASVKTPTSTQKLILLLLADRAGDDNTCFPSLKRISNDACVSRRCVIENIKKLASNGFIAVEKRTIEAEETGTIYNKSNLYLLNVGSYPLGDSDADYLVVNSGNQGGEAGSLGGEAGSLGVVNEVHPNQSVESVMESVKEPMSDSDESSCSDFQNRTNQSPHPKDVSAQGKKQKGPPPWEEVEKWATKWAADNSKSKQAVLRQARAAFDAYTRNMKTLGARTWKDSHGNTVKIWKTKIVNNWFKEEQLSPSQGGQKINAVEFM